MSELEAKLNVQEHTRAAALYRLHGDNPQLLSQDIWKEMQRIDQNPALKNHFDMKERVKEEFLIALKGISHDDREHKSAYVNFTKNVYSDEKGNFEETFHAGAKDYEKNILIGTNERWTSNDMKDLSKFPKPSPAEMNKATEDANTLYSYLGNKHNNINNFKDLFNNFTNHTQISNGNNETEKASRDRAMEELASKANSERSCPYKFELLGADQNHYEGFKVTLKNKPQAPAVVIGVPRADTGY